MTDLKVTGVLFLKNVFLSDLDEKQDQESVKVEEKKQRIYSNFIDINGWPKTTDIKCWYCGLNFEGIPWFEPLMIEPLSDNVGCDTEICTDQDEKDYKPMHVVATRGIYCSCSCVLANVVQENCKINYIDKINMIRYVYEKITGHTAPEILQPSPSYTLMKDYGGDMTVDQYKKMIKKIMFGDQ